MGLEQRSNEKHREALLGDFWGIHRQLSRNASEAAAEVVLKLAMDKAVGAES